MLQNTSFKQVYLARGATDLRKSIDGLALIVKECFSLDPFSPCLFVFCNRKRDKLKILEWCILQLKSLEKCKEKFRTLPALNFDVTNDLIKHFSRGNYHQ